MSRAAMPDDPLLVHAFDGILVRYLDLSRQVLIVELNRPNKLNAMDWNFWRDYSKVRSKFYFQFSFDKCVAISVPSCSLCSPSPSRAILARQLKLKAKLPLLQCFPLADPGAEPNGADAFSWHDGSVRCVSPTHCTG